MILFILFIIIKVTTINNNKLKLSSSKLYSYNNYIENFIAAANNNNVISVTPR